MFVGVISFFYGLFSVFGIIKEDTSKDSEMDKKLLSEETRYFIGRYYAGSQFIMVGIGTVVLGYILYVGNT